MLSYLQSFHVDMRILRCISLTRLLDMGMNINVYHVKLWTDDAHLCSSITCFNTVMIASDEWSNLIVKWNNLTSRSDTVTPKGVTAISSCFGILFSFFPQWFEIFVPLKVKFVCYFITRFCLTIRKSTSMPFRLVFLSCIKQCLTEWLIHQRSIMVC